MLFSLCTLPKARSAKMSINKKQYTVVCCYNTAQYNKIGESEREYQGKAQSTKNTPYLTLTGKLWVSFFQHIWSPYGANGQIIVMLHNNRSRQFHRRDLNNFSKSEKEKIHPAVSGIRNFANSEPHCNPIYMFLSHGQDHIGQMGKWPSYCIVIVQTTPQKFK